MLLYFCSLFLSIAAFGQQFGFVTNSGPAPGAALGITAEGPVQPGSDPVENVPGTPLTIEQALALAERNSPLLRESEARVGRARAGIQTARTYINPALEVYAGHQSARDIATPGVPGLLQHYGLAQPIEIPNERRARIQTAQLELISTRHRMDGIRLSVLADVNRAFFDVLRRKQQVGYARQNMALVEDLRRRVSLEVQTGEKGKLEMTRAEAELARTRAAVNTAEAQLANSRAILKAVLGVSADQNFDAQGAISNTVQLPDLETLRAHVLASHPALMEAESRVMQSQKIVDHERALRIPQPVFYSEYERQPDITYWRSGVSVAVPLWDRRKGPVAEAEAERIRTQHYSRQRRLELMAALESAYERYQISDQQVQGLQAGSLREAEAAVNAATAAYKFGERGMLEVLDAQRVLQAVRTDLLDAQFARQSAFIDLEELGATQKP